MVLVTFAETKVTRLQGRNPANKNLEGIQNLEMDEGKTG